jgi:hypothetical protein
MRSKKKKKSKHAKGQLPSQKHRKRKEARKLETERRMGEEGEKKYVH